MNTKQKGQKKELLCAKELQSQGYYIAFRAFTVKRGPCFVGVDFADTFDVVALKECERGGEGPVTWVDPPKWKFISCSFVSHKAEKVAAVEAFKDKFSPAGIDPGVDVSFEVWLWTPARYRGRGKEKHWEQAKWEKIVV